MNDSILQAEKALSDNRNKYFDAVEAIQADESLSEKGKKQQIDELYNAGLKEHDKLKAERRQAIADFAEQKRKKLFTLKDASISDQLAYDKAVSEFSGMSKQQLENLLETGSQATQKAVFKASYQAGLTSVFDKYVELNPDVYKDAQALVDWDEKYGKGKTTTFKMKEKVLERFPKDPEAVRT
jgi:hypothetical protein